MADAERPQVILICLGNPGPRYARTRHNAGVLFGEWLRGQYDLPEPAEVMGAPAAGVQAVLHGLNVLLVWPTVPMNDNGAVLTALLGRYGAEDILWAIAYDDLDLALGKAKGRQKGGDGGHNGVRSILGAAGGTNVFRIKLGVASAEKSRYESPRDFLLDDFSPSERDALAGAFPRAEQVFVGQLKSLAAQLAKLNRHAELTARFESEWLDEVRSLTAGLPGVSPRPVFLTRAQMGRAFDVATAVAKLLRKARRAAADSDRIAARLRCFLPPHLGELVPEYPSSDRLFFAVDLHVAGDRVKVVELNCAVGYAQYARLADERVFPFLADKTEGLQRPSRTPFGEFLYREGLRPLHDPDCGAIAFLRGFGDRDMFNVDELKLLAESVGEAGGLEVPLCHESDLTLHEDGLHLPDGQRVDVLYVEENLSEWEQVGPDSQLARAVKGGLVKTFPDLSTFLFTNKGFLTVLVDPSSSEWLTPDDQESKVLRENVLWSAPLDARTEPAAYYMLEQGLPLVVKSALGGGGRGVMILRPDSASQQTGHLLRQRLQDGDAIVQGWFAAGPWREGSDLRFDVRVVVAAHESDIAIGPVYGRVFRGEKANFADADSGAAPVYVID